MNASAVFAFFVITLVALISGFPTDEDAPPQGLYIKVKEEGKASHAVVPFETGRSGIRVRRATCDLMSISTPWVTVNHAACAAHCIWIGYKGGICINGICHCRN